MVKVVQRPACYQVWHDRQQRGDPKLTTAAAAHLKLCCFHICQVLRWHTLSKHAVSSDGAPCCGQSVASFASRFRATVPTVDTLRGMYAVLSGDPDEAERLFRRAVAAAVGILRATDTKRN